MPLSLLLVLTLKPPLRNIWLQRAGQENRSCSLIHHCIHLGLQLTPGWPLTSRVPRCWIVPSLPAAWFQELLWGLEVSSESDGSKTAVLTRCVGSCEDAELLERACLIPSFASTGLRVMQLLQFKYSVSAVLISAFKLSQGHQGGMAYFE